MKSIAAAHQNRSLSEFEGALKEWKEGMSSRSIGFVIFLCPSFLLYLLSLTLL